MLKPIRRVRLYENAVEQIQTLILGKKYEPGDRLPSERSLAEQFRISRHSLLQCGLDKTAILRFMAFQQVQFAVGVVALRAQALPGQYRFSPDETMLCSRAMPRLGK